MLGHHMRQQRAVEGRFALCLETTLAAETLQDLTRAVRIASDRPESDEETARTESDRIEKALPALLAVFAVAVVVFTAN